MDNTIYQDISVIEEILLQEANKSLESLFRNEFGNRDKTIKVIGYIEAYLISDLKSYLIEEFAWYFDYIRNIMTESDKDKLLNKVQDILSGTIKNNNNNEEKGNLVRSLLISSVGENVNENQKKFGLEEVFTKKKKNSKDLSEFKKATGGLPDVVSITTEGKISFTAANSLTSLQMEYDQIERHSAVIAIGIYNFEEKCGFSLEEVVKGDNEKLKKEIGKSITQAFEDNKGSKGQTRLYESLNESTTDRLKKIKDILNNKIDVTFFQTYTSKNVSRALLEDLIIKDNNITEENKPTEDEMTILVKEKYREINHMTSFLLGNAQTAYNQKNESYKKELMANNVKAINLKSQPKVSNNFKVNNELFKNHIIEKMNSEEGIGSWLDYLVKVNIEGESELEKEYPKSSKSSKLMDITNNDEILDLLNMPSGDIRKVADKKAIENLEMKINRGEIDGNVEDYIAGLKDLYSYAAKYGITTEQKNEGYQKGKLEEIRDSINEKRKPIERLDGDKTYNTIDMSMINMFKVIRYTENSSFNRSNKCSQRESS